ncbi:mitochondrial inner membrane protein OXA1-like [Nymphaea colorata]|nr:mitochondrial inner membrane protein OXA1-like [Nymphaea colorata]
MASSAAGGGGRRISSSLSLLIRTHHLSASTTSALHHHHRHDDPTTSSPPPQSRPIFGRPRHLLPDREILAVSSWLKPRRPYGVLLPLGAVSAPRYYSSSTIGEETDKIEYMNDVAEVLTEKAVEAVVQTPGVDEVAVAAADSFLPVAALQYLIDAVHHYSGLNWWAAIALTTLLIRGMTVPLLINQLKATSKLTLMRPQLEEISNQMRGATDMETLQESRQRVKKLYKEYGVTPLTPMKGIFIQGPVFISFYLAISNMVEKVPSFKEGGAFWFVDLTTPDTLYIFPVMTALSFLITVEMNLQEGMEGNPVAGTMKNFSRILAVATVPFTMNFPKAIFCYWITSNLFSLCYGFVIKRPPVKKFLGLPEIVPPSAPPPNFSLFSQPKSEPSAAAVLPAQPPKISEKRITSSSAVSQRLRNLERTVKGRKRNKKV